jgi:hypothetical protein
MPAAACGALSVRSAFCDCVIGHVSVSLCSAEYFVCFQDSEYSVRWQQCGFCHKPCARREQRSSRTNYRHVRGIWSRCTAVCCIRNMVIIYFNRPKVTAHLLDEDAASAPRQFPLSITIIAWILILGGLLGLLGLLFMAYPFLFLGFIIHGLASRLLYLLFVVLSVASGVGMLRRRVEAHALAVGYFAFALLNLFFYILTPSSFVRFMQEMPGGQNLPADSTHAFFLMGNVFGLLSTSLVLWFLITCRQRFIAACVR